MSAVPGQYDGEVRRRRRRIDDRVVPHRRRSRLRVRDWHMRTKLGAVLIIPSVAFLVLAGIQTTSLVGQATSLNEFAQQLRAGQQISALIHDLQRERDRTAGEMAFLAGRRANPASPQDRAAVASSLAPAYQMTDRSIADFRRTAAPLQNSNKAWEEAYGRADEVLNQLPAIREAVPTGSVTSTTISTAYGRRIEALIAMLSEPSPGPQRPDLTTAVQRYAQFAQAKESVSQAREQLYAMARAGNARVTDTAREELTELRSREAAELGAFRVIATPEQVSRYEEATSGGPAESADALADASLLPDAQERKLPNASNYWSISEQRHDLLRGFETSVFRDAIRLADVGSGAQARRALVITSLLFAVLLLAIMISVVIGRSLARSLRMLRAQALQVAQLELPEALNRLRAVGHTIPDIRVSSPVIRSMDEIGEVAEAFTAVHRSAVAVAVEQAVMRRNVNAMFVNLARRSQVLVERQLELLDELEREEGDPDQLDNLFKLDHLAARMRRNDESLLILAGTDSSRRWNQPAPMTTVMLAAVAEIEQYQRVRHDVGEPLFIVGHAIADLVHLLAELLENATAFSPPDSAVTMTGRRAAGDTALIEIVDQGLGMTSEALEEANELLASPPAADVAASERMGLFVVSHLAARLGVRVQLQAADRGLVAAVWLPEAVLAGAAPPELSQPTTRPMLAVSATTATTVLPRLAPPVAPAQAARGATRVGTLPEPIRALPYPAELPVAGRRPEPMPARQPEPVPGRQPEPMPARHPEPIAPAPRRAVPTRAESVLPPPVGAGRSSSVWWSRQPGAAPAAHAPAPAAAPPATPITGGMSASGLPLRVPMAQLPNAGAPAPDPAPRPELDPEATGGMLTRFYGAVRRAEAEETDIVAAPVGARRGREQG